MTGEEMKLGIAWKICNRYPSRKTFSPCLVTLEIPPTAVVIPTEYNPNGEILAFRCNRAKVTSIVALCLEDGVFAISDEPTTVAYSCFYNSANKALCYEIGRRIWVRDFDGRDYVAGSNGIHCFTSQVAALMYYQPHEMR